MFGFSFGELVVLVVVAIVVIGPKDLPKVLRTMGQWAGKLRRMAADLRQQSGIDDVLRTEGLTDDLNEIRKLARGELDAVSRAATVGSMGSVGALGSLGSGDGASPHLAAYESASLDVDRDREQPREGPDTGNALPDTAFVYAPSFPRSKWADDPVWVLGDPNGVVPKPEPAADSPIETEPHVEPASATAAAPADAPARTEPA